MNDRDPKRTGKQDTAATRAIHAGQAPDATGAIMTPIYDPTYVQTSPGVHGTTTRTANLTRAPLGPASPISKRRRRAPARLAWPAWPRARRADTGAHVIAMSDLYGGTYRLFENVRKRSAGLAASFIDMTDPESVRAAIRPQTRMLWVETPSNPLLKLVDLAAVAEIAREYDLITVADNTFASPWIQQPLALGFDIVVHSATKYLNGHSDMVGGVVVIGGEPRHQALGERLGYLQNAVGGISGAFDSFLVLRGLKTLALRMERIAATPGSWRTGSPDNARSQRCTTRDSRAIPARPGAAADARVWGDGDDRIENRPCRTKRFLERCRLLHWRRVSAASSLIEHPALMTHGSIPEPQRAALGMETRWCACR